jgi:hypothetical protein
VIKRGKKKYKNTKKGPAKNMRNKAQFGPLIMKKKAHSELSSYKNKFLGH